MKRSQLLTYLSAGAMVIWLAFITVLIGSQPQPGAASRGELTTAFLAAARDHDIDRARLLIKGDLDDEWISAVLSGARCGDSVQTDDLHLKILDFDGTECDRLAIAENDGRWFVVAG